MVVRDGKLYQRRHQIGFDGKEANAIEFEARLRVGSGNHARTFLHRNPDGRLLQLPVSWYAERGGYWAMSPGYDRPSHLDFRRPIDAGCMSCHNAYPRTPVEDDGVGPRFGDALPEGIDCQRCHGPGRRTSTPSRRARSTPRSAPLSTLRSSTGNASSKRACNVISSRRAHLFRSRFGGTTIRRFHIHRASRSATISCISIMRRGAVETTSSKSRAARIGCASPPVFSAAR